MELIAIGRVESPLKDARRRAQAGRRGCPGRVARVRAAVRDGLDGIAAGDDLLVLTWLDRAERDVLRVIPRGDVTRGVQGVFNTRSPDRPNPIGLHRVDGPRRGRRAAART